METQTKETVEKEKPAETPQNKVMNAVVVIALAAFGTMVLGSLTGAPWPAAVAACGMCLMGVGAAWFSMRRH